MRNITTHFIPPRAAVAAIGIPYIRLREIRLDNLFTSFGKPVGNYFVYSMVEIVFAATAACLADVGITWRRGCIFVSERQHAITGLLFLAEAHSEDYILTLTFDRNTGTCSVVDCERSDRVKFSEAVPITIRINISMILRTAVARVDEFEAAQRRAQPYRR